MSISTDRLFAVTQVSGATSPRQPHTLSQADLTARNRRAIGVAHSYAHFSLYRYRRPHPANDAAGAVALLCAAESWRATTGTVCSVAMQHEVELMRAQATSMLDATTESAACHRGRSRSLRDALLDLQDRIHALQATPAVVAPDLRVR